MADPNNPMKKNEAKRSRPMLGVIMLDTRFPRLPGDIGNPDTFDFPVRYQRVTHARVASVVKSTAITDELISGFIDAARSLEEEGVDLITTSCGFLVPLQKKLQQAVNVPVFSSSLLLIPLLQSIHGPKAVIGILTFDSRCLAPIHINDIDDDQLVIHGMEHGEELFRAINNDETTIDYARAEKEVVEAAKRLAAHPQRPQVILFECSNLSPYINAVRRETSLPVYDLTQTVSWMLGARGIADYAA